jgi:hypothetical protein
MPSVFRGTVIANYASMFGAGFATELAVYALSKNVVAATAAGTAVTSIAYSIRMSLYEVSHRDSRQEKAPGGGRVPNLRTPAACTL